MLIRLTAIGVALAAVAPASAVVLDFDNFKPVNQDFSNSTSIYGAIVEDGFRVSSSLCEAPSGGRPAGRCFLTEQRFRSIDIVGAAIKTAFQGQTITVAQVDGSAFLFESFDLRSAYGTTPTNVDLRYTFVDGTVGTTRFALAGSSTAPFNTFAIPNLAPITSISFDPVERNGAFQFDNIRVSAVMAAIPEPTTWAMMIGGFGLVGGALRRRNSSVVTA